MIAAHPNIIGLRDLQSVTDMTERLALARTVVVVGNGGIALELVHSVSICLAAQKSFIYVYLRSGGEGG